VRIFVEIEHIKNQGITFWPERIWPLFPTLWSSHEIWPNSQPLHSMWNNCLILLGQNVTPRFLMCSISTNILMVLANFLGIMIQFFQKKHWSWWWQHYPSDHHMVSAWKNLHSRSPRHLWCLKFNLPSPSTIRGPFFYSTAHFIATHHK